jgi:hypothetical protein
MMHFEHELGKEATVLGLSNKETDGLSSHHVSPRYANKLNLFGPNVSYSYLAGAMSRGAVVKTTSITESFTYEAYLARYNKELVPLVFVDGKKVGVFSANQTLQPKPGWKIISLVLKPNALA